MQQRDHSQLLAELREAYARFAPSSGEIQSFANRFLIDGVSHQLRFTAPFPPRIVSARGAYVNDEDGHRILDFWQGHMGNVLGHNPPAITEELARAFSQGHGLQTGFADRLQAEAAEILCRQTRSERVRFTTSGSLATMYAIMLARAYTGRTGVLKIGGGWHGAQPWGLKGVNFHQDKKTGFSEVDSEGLPASASGEVAVTEFNDTQGLCDIFQKKGDQLACFIVEPMIGAGGMIPATREFLDTARELSRRHGTLLILDEVICGFRFRAGNLGEVYGISPDLSVFGKMIGGGMPVAAVAGREDVMQAAAGRVKFSGGTFSSHPASMLAAKTAMQYLVEHEQEIYPRLAALGEKMRHSLELAFRNEGICARCTGAGDQAIAGSSLAYVHFPYREDTVPDRPEKLYDPEICDVELSAHVLQMALMLENVYMVHGHGAASAAHSDADMEWFDQACRRAARRIKAGTNF